MNVCRQLQRDFPTAGFAALSGRGDMDQESAPPARAKSYSIHNLVTLLQERVPPRTRPIDISNKHWLQQVWADVFDRLGELQHADENFAQLLRQICAVVINYDSISEPGFYGGRHTAALLNLDRVKGRPQRRVRGLSSLTGQNHVFFYEGDAEAVGRKGKTPARDVTQAFWQDNWRRYMLLDNGPDDRKERDPATFTLNNMLLRRAVYPRPVLITWDEKSEEAPAWAQALAPITVHVPELIRSPEAPTPGFDAFLSGFQAMFEQHDGQWRDRAGHDWIVDADSVTRMLQALLRHFGSIGGNAFFTIPVMLLVAQTRGRVQTYHELRAAVSVVLTLPRDDLELASAGWFFFESFANRVLTSILASEFVALSDSRWANVRADSANLASHPIKNKSRPALAAQTSLLGTIEKITLLVEGILRGAIAEGEDGSAEARPDAPVILKVAPADLETLRLLLARARQFCAKAMTNVQILDGIVNLMSLLLDLGPELQEAIAESTASAGPRTRKIDLFQFLTKAAEGVADKKLGSQSVRIESAEKPVQTMRSRFDTAKLRKYRDLETILYGAIFAELLQNAANYGIDPRDPKSTCIPVTVETGSPLRIRNYVHPRGQRGLAAKAQQVSSDAALDRMSSGLYFVKRAFAELGIGKIYARVSWEKVPGTPGDQDHMFWEYFIYFGGS